MLSFVFKNDPTVSQIQCSFFNSRLYNLIGFVSAMIQLTPDCGVDLPVWCLNDQNQNFAYSSFFCSRLKLTAQRLFVWESIQSPIKVIPSTSIDKSLCMYSKKTLQLTFTADINPQTNKRSSAFESVELAFVALKKATLA